MDDRLTPEQIERLLAGRGADEPGLEALDQALSELRAHFAVAPDASVRKAHLAAMKRVQIEPAAARRSRRPRRRLARASVAAFGLVLVGGTAMAGTGTLPDAVQDAVADAVDAVVDIPGGANENIPSNPVAAANKREAIAFTHAKRAWLACVKEARAAFEGAEESFDAEAACGEKPNRQTFKADKGGGKPDKTPKAEKTDKPAKTDKPDKTPKAAVEHTPKPPKTPNPNAGGSGGSEQGPAKTPNPNAGGGNPNKP